MGRLIDADRLYDDLTDKLKWLMGYGDDVYLSVGDNIRCAIAEQPTAYDPDKVVAQLEKKIQTHKHVIEYEKKNGTITEEFQQRKAVEVLEGAIDIVKAGGVDGN